MHHDAIIILKLALNAHNWPARKLFFIFASLTEHLFWSACMDGRPACSAMILYYSTLFVSEKKKKKGNSLTSTQHMCIIQHYLKNKHFSALAVMGRTKWPATYTQYFPLGMRLPPGLQSPFSFHLGCGKQKMPVQKHILYLPISSGLMMILNHTCTHTDLITVIS